MFRSLPTNRLALVVLLAVLAGVGAGLLSTLAGDGPARSALCGIGAMGAAVQALSLLIAPARVAGGSAARRSKTEDGHG